MITDIYPRFTNLSPPTLLASTAIITIAIATIYYLSLRGNPEKKPFKICVICEKYPDNGSGDLTFACKIAEFIQKRFGAKANVSLHGLSEYEMDFLTKDFIRNRVSLEIEIQTFRKIPEPDGKTLLIHGPVLQGIFPGILCNQYKKKDIWHIGEYSNGGMIDISVERSGSVLSSGFGKDELGVFYNKPSEEALQHSVENRMLQNLKSKEEASPFYFGYAASFHTAAPFILTCLCHQHANTQNFDICLSGNLMRDPENLKNLKEELRKNQEVFQKTGIQEILFYLDETLPPILLEIHTHPATKKRIRILLPGHLSHKDMEKLSLESHSHFTVATEDQSISENLGNKFMTEVPFWKCNSFNNLLDLVREFNFFKLANFLEMGKCNKDSLNENFEELSKLIDDPKLQDEILAFSEKIGKDHNLEINLGIKIEEWMESKLSRLLRRTV